MGRSYERRVGRHIRVLHHTEPTNVLQHAPNTASDSPPAHTACFKHGIQRSKYRRSIKNVLLLGLGVAVVYIGHHLRFPLRNVHCAAHRSLECRTRIDVDGTLIQNEVTQQLCTTVVALRGGLESKPMPHKSPSEWQLSMWWWSSHDLAMVYLLWYPCKIGRDIADGSFLVVDPLANSNGSITSAYSCHFWTRLKFLRQVDCRYIFIHTVKAILIEVNPHVRISRVFNLQVLRLLANQACTRNFWQGKTKALI